MPEGQAYFNKHGGLHNFQINLGITLLNYAIALEWNGNENWQPMWMTKCNNFVPCDCGKCYFCINGRTNGVGHKHQQKVAIVYSCRKRVCITGCTEDRVNLDKGSDYYKMCCRKQPHAWNVAKKKLACRSSRLGCAGCKETICGSCWQEGYDNHVGRKKRSK